jgi:TetR/AcrR family transcriptional regulator
LGIRDGVLVAKTSEPEEMVRLRRRQQRSIDTRDRILEAATAEFAEHGFEGASTRNVAENAGVQHPLLTYHFENKEGLWRAVLTSLNERFIALYRARLEGLRGVDAPTKLRLILEDFIRFSAENPAFHWLMSHEGSKGGRRMNWLVDEYVGQFFGEITPLIKASQKEGRFVAGDPHHLLYIFVGAVTRLFMLGPEVKKVSGRNPNTAAYVDEHVKLCLGLFLRDPGPSSGSS